jgi:hypothetical protein
MASATHASAGILGATMIVTIIVVERVVELVVVKGPLRRAECGTGV